MSELISNTGRNQNQILKRSNFNLLAFVFIGRWKKSINSIILKIMLCYVMLCYVTTRHKQGSTNFPQIHGPPSNSRRHTVVREGKDSYDYAENTRCQGIKFCRRWDQEPRICAPLVTCKTSIPLSYRRLRVSLIHNTAHHCEHLPGEISRKLIVDEHSMVEWPGQSFLGQPDEICLISRKMHPFV
jgi:hypothetical protein